MADLQNVTVSLPADLLREARHLAVDQGLSLSSYLALLLKAEVELARGRRAARERQRGLLEAGLSLGTRGRVSWRREVLHER